MFQLLGRLLGRFGPSELAWELNRADSEWWRRRARLLDLDLEWEYLVSLVAEAGAYLKEESVDDANGDVASFRWIQERPCRTACAGIGRP